EARGDGAAEAVERRLLKLEGRGEAAVEDCRRQLERVAADLRAEALGRGAAAPRQQLQLDQLAARLEKLEQGVEERGSTLGRQAEERLRRLESRAEAAEELGRAQQELLEKGRRHELRLAAVAKVADEALAAGAHAEEFLQRSQRLLEQLETDLRAFVQGSVEALEGRLAATAGEVGALASSVKSRDQGLERRVADAATEVACLQSALRAQDRSLAEARAEARAGAGALADQQERLSTELQAAVQALSCRVERGGAAALRAAEDAVAQRSADRAEILELRSGLDAVVRDVKGRVEELELSMVEARSSASTLVAAFGSLAPRIAAGAPPPASPPSAAAAEPVAARQGSVHLASPPPAAPAVSWPR
ncbi:unnamed protein product, partial [Prorocentrum cordatum]